MPIASQKLNAPVPVETRLPTVQPDSYQGLVTGIGNYPITTLITYTSGAPWSVEYYSQILGQHNDLKDFDPSLDSPYQQYTLIKDMEIRVSSPLSGSYNNNTSVMKVTGAATVPFTLIPNIGDVFTAVMDEGDRAIFRVTNVERKSFNRPSVYHIEYEIAALVSTHPEWFDIIQQKVQRVYHFHKDRMVDGLDSLVTTDQHQAIRETREFLNKAPSRYFKTFYNKAYGTLVMPYQDLAYYDPFLVRSMLKICSVAEAPEILHIHNLSIQHDLYLSQPTIWDALIERDLGILNMCNKKMAFIMPSHFIRNARIDSARYQQVHRILYPFDPDISVRLNIQLPPADVIDEDLEDTTGHHGNTDNSYNVYQATSGPIAVLPPLWVDRYYVLSAAFYNDTTGKSLLETLVMDYMEGRSLDVRKLLAITKNWHRWTRMEQFYYTPVVIFLLRRALGSVSL